MSTYLAAHGAQLMADFEARMAADVQRSLLPTRDYINLLSQKELAPTPTKKAAHVLCALIRVGAVQLGGKLLSYTPQNRLPMQIENTAQLRAVCWQELNIEISGDEAELIFALAHMGRSQTDHDRQWLANKRAGQSEGL